LLKEIEISKEEACINLTKKFDKYDGEIVVSKERIEQIDKELDQKTKDDIQFSHERVKKFAEAQLKNYGQDFEVELSPGLYAGQKLIPVNTAGCYIPGGRYAHIASAVMSVTTAKVAGVKNIIACSPPKEGVGAHPAIIYTANLCGADVILNLGGVPGIAAMTNGLFKNPPADILVGPGNQFVAEAKRILFGKVGIDLFAGPTEIAVIADDEADAEMVAVDLVGQAEHGYNSPAWLYTTSQRVADEVMKRVPELIAELPEMMTLTFCLGFANQKNFPNLFENLWKKLLLNSKKSKSLEVLQSPFKLVQATEIEIGIAWRSETMSIPFSQSLNKISGDIICPYPPGIPLLVPGEKIDIDRFNWINNQSLCNKDLLNFNIRVIKS